MEDNDGIEALCANLQHFNKYSGYLIKRLSSSLWENDSNVCRMSDIKSFKTSMFHLENSRIWYELDKHISITSSHTTAGRDDSLDDVIYVKKALIEILSIQAIDMDSTGINIDSGDELEFLECEYNEAMTLLIAYLNNDNIILETSDVLKDYGKAIELVTMCSEDMLQDVNYEDFSYSIPIGWYGPTNKLVLLNTYGGIAI